MEPAVERRYCGSKRPHEAHRQERIGYPGRFIDCPGKQRG